MSDKERIIGKLIFYEDKDMRLALDAGRWISAMTDLDNWLRSKVKHESGLEDKEGEELEHYVDAYDKAREQLYLILEGYGINLYEY